MFGAELRRRRKAVDLSQTALAKKVHYSQGHLSRIENGHYQPSRDRVRQIDRALGADGALVHADMLDRSASHGQEPAMHSPVPPPDPAALSWYYQLLDTLRQRGRQQPSGEVLPTVRTYAAELLRVAQQVPMTTRAPWLSAAARFHEYAGWLAQELGQDTHAWTLTDQAARAAAAASDHDLASYTFIRHALIAMYTENPALTITLAHRAQADPLVSPRVCGLAALREAQGHALAGNRHDCENALGRARTLLDEDVADGIPILGSSAVPGLVDTTAGWCWFDLDQPARAAAILEVEMTKIPQNARRARARFGVRLMLAHASANNLDRTHELAETVLADARQVASATIRHDLRKLNRTLGQRPGNRPVNELCHQISSLVSPGLTPT